MTPYVLPLHTSKKYGPEPTKKLRTYMNAHLFYIKLIYWLHQVGTTSALHRCRIETSPVLIRHGLEP